MAKIAPVQEEMGDAPLQPQTDAPLQQKIDDEIITSHQLQGCYCQYTCYGVCVGWLCRVPFEDDPDRFKECGCKTVSCLPVCPLMTHPTGRFANNFARIREVEAILKEPTAEKYKDRLTENKGVIVRAFFQDKEAKRYIPMETIKWIDQGGTLTTNTPYVSIDVSTTKGQLTIQSDDVAKFIPREPPHDTLLHETRNMKSLDLKSLAKNRFSSYASADRMDRMLGKSGYQMITKEGVPYSATILVKTPKQSFNDGVDDTRLHIHKCCSSCTCCVRGCPSAQFDGAS